MRDIPLAPTRPSRRDLITAKVSRRSLHIASLYVQAWPERIDGLVPLLNHLDGVEVHDTDTRGRMILTIEIPSDAALLNTISKIEQTEGVITASLVFHQIEDLGDDQ